MNFLTKGHNCKSSAIPSHLDADTFNEHFLSVAKKLSSTETEPYACPDILEEFCKERTAGTQRFTIPQLAVHEVGKLISMMANKKSSGPDDVSPRILKISLPYTVTSLTHIYNLCIEQNTFPAAWKMGKVIPLPKTTDHSDVNNYRPISLLSVLSKPLERHVHKHLLSYLETRQLIHPSQSGFRPGHSCHTALTRMTETWLSAINNSQINGVVFLDLKKAFDLVNHDILLKKLVCYLGGVENTLFFKSYLERRQQKVLLNGFYSAEGHVQCGVPQGSVLGPLLFCTFINDLPMQIHNTHNLSIELFADDSTLHTADSSITGVNSRLQGGVAEVNQWCHTNRMVLNPSKTEAMVITTRQKHQLTPLLLNLSVNKTPIKQVQEHKLLGVTIDSKLSWDSHIDSTCKALSRNLFLLSKLKHYLDADARKLYYTAHIRSRIDYASTLWDGASENILKRMNSLHRRSAKLILQDPLLTTDEKMEKLEILPLNFHLHYNKCIIMFKIQNNLLPKQLCDSFTPSVSRYMNHRMSFIVPKARIDMYKRSLCFSGSTLWNSLPLSVKCAPSLAVFKSSVFKCYSSKLS